MQDVALHGGAVDQELSQQNRLLAHVDPERLLGGLQRRHLVADRADAADARGDQGDVGVRDSP